MDTVLEDITITDLENVPGNSFLKPDEIAMLYDEKEDVLVSPFYSSLLNFMRELKLEPVKRGHILPIDNHRYSAFFSDGYNVVALRYEIRPVLTKFFLSESEVIEKPLLFIYIDSKAVAPVDDDYMPAELSLVDLVKNYKKNASKEVFENLFRIVKLLDLKKHKGASYII